MKFLVVDDDPLVLDLVTLVLQQEGHKTIHTARSGVEALDLLRTYTGIYDVLVLDISMPEMNGIALCHHIRHLPGYKNTPIIMLTANSDSISIEKAFAAGANDYITKPFDVKSIGGRIQIARRMMDEHQISYAADQDYFSEPGKIGEHEFGVSDPIRITGMEQHTDTFSLGNYLLQLAKKRVNETYVFAAQIDDFTSIYENSDSQTLLVTISEVWRAISSAADDNRLLGAYFGSGVFMCIATSDIQDLWNKMEHDVVAILQRSERLKKIGASTDIPLIVGRPVKPNASKTKRVRPSFNRAISLLEKRKGVSESPLDDTSGPRTTTLRPRDFPR
ncbi:response regulator [Sulfitobacter sp. F26204]|uniref:response regulator n=1 Tax=Sulfitobacter sp. F26204 TaxID=2996014 RepID=UPI00225E1E67|nr:response regulator [Sulfitobacter sp. F26204]MCX7560202.1 response regulator [Sulfitobacter sp. F26204]